MCVGEVKDKVNPPPKPYLKLRSAAGGPGGRWGSVVLGWRALRPPRVVFVLGFVSLINSLTLGKKAVVIKIVGRSGIHTRTAKHSWPRVLKLGLNNNDQGRLNLGWHPLQEDPALALG